MSSDRKPRQRAPHQLPPGRHKLSREFVRANQRARILDAVIDVVSLVGFQTMSVEDVIATAGVSRRTFYDHFKGKEDAFLAALEEIASELVDQIQATYDASETFAGCVAACLSVFIEFVAAEPRYADACLVEVLAAGPTAIERRNEVMKRLAHLLHAGAQTLLGQSTPRELTAETVIGGIYEVAYSRVLQGSSGELPALLPDLVYSMLLPYVGHAAAEREARGAVAAGE